MEEGSGHKKAGLTDEELAKEVQAAFDAEGSGDEEESSIGEVGEELDEAGTELFNAITIDNMRQYLAEATAYKLSKNYEKACLILKIILMKGEALYGDAMHPELVSYYYSLGDLLMEEIEHDTEKVEVVEAEGAPEHGAQNGATPAAAAQGQGNSAVVNDLMGGSGVDPQGIQAAWENLEVARYILQKKVDAGGFGEEEKKAILGKLATVMVRLADCESWQDKFKEAIENYQHALDLRTQTENPATSRSIAEMYFGSDHQLLYDGKRTHFLSRTFQFGHRN